MTTTTTLNKLIDSGTTVVWLRRDLRLEDNAAFYHALRENQSVLPVFIFDTEILIKLDDKADKRVDFIHQALMHLKQKLENLGCSLLVVYDNPVDFYQGISPKAVYTNTDYEPYARERDQRVAQILGSKAIAFRSFKDQVIFEKDEIIKSDRNPYTVFTPYSKKWKATLNPFYLSSYPVEKYLKHLKPIQPLAMPSLQEIGFKETHAHFPERIIPKKRIESYDQQRDYPGIKGTTRLGVHLRFGTISIRQLARLAKNKNETWLNELIWRDFYQMILWHFPEVNTKSFKPAYDRIQWRHNEDDFKKWCEGKTGYPLVDAGMRELNATGFMHNRVRMVTASFLTKHLGIDWRWGEAYFAGKLLDYDMAANNGGWQWAAGCGCDAAPYFRIFNPALQQKKFDPHFTYVKKWVPEFGTPEYCKPMVDHTHARERAIKIYHSALRQ